MKSADGWFAYRADTSADNGYVNMTSSTRLCSISTTNSVRLVGGLMPCKKGDTIQVDYTPLTTIPWFRFVYSVGSEPLA